MAAKDIVKYQFTSDQDRTQASLAGQKGGVARGEQRRRARDIKTALRAILQSDLMPTNNTEMLQALEAMGVDKPTNAEGIACAAAVKAARGDIEAARYVRDSAGELPTQRVEMGGIEDGAPLSVLDMSKLTDAQLRAIALERASEESPENEG